EPHLQVQLRSTQQNNGVRLHSGRPTDPMGSHADAKCAGTPSWPPPPRWRGPPESNYSGRSCPEKREILREIRECLGSRAFQFSSRRVPVKKAGRDGENVPLR